MVWRVSSLLLSKKNSTAVARTWNRDIGAGSPRQGARRGNSRSSRTRSERRGFAGARCVCGSFSQTRVGSEHRTRSSESDPSAPRDLVLGTREGEPVYAFCDPGTSWAAGGHLAVEACERIRQKKEDLRVARTFLARAGNWVFYAGELDGGGAVIPRPCIPREETQEKTAGRHLETQKRRIEGGAHNSCDVTPAECAATATATAESGSVEKKLAGGAGGMSCSEGHGRDVALRGAAREAEDKSQAEGQSGDVALYGAASASRVVRGRGGCEAPGSTLACAEGGGSGTDGQRRLEMDLGRGPEIRPCAIVPAMCDSTSASWSPKVQGAASAMVSPSGGGVETNGQGLLRNGPSHRGPVEMWPRAPPPARRVGCQRDGEHEKSQH
ncbi:hypothetical protein GGX14DRAFT_604024 [Mycena pura]|uniref:Uncharacterized protein n=1 Tax=Mycena pura TaxID=153505 RepID=A0AAD6UM62_9AGAR|nr:hypothetical protein GGX14DRAFT_604024 [Mycena pura]